MELSPRLNKIAESIRGYESVADIGSDHAYLPIYLIKEGIVKKAVASDINKGPVETAKKKMRQHGIEAGIDVRRGNGLEVISPGETDVIVIAGMGGILIREILERDGKVAESAKLLVIQPMRDSDKVRKWLFEKGFGIIDEELIKEEDRIYEIIWAKPGYESRKTEREMLVGDLIVEKKHPLAAEFIDKKVKELEKVVSDLADKDTENSRKRTEECKRLLKYYREVKQWVQ